MQKYLALFLFLSLFGFQSWAQSDGDRAKAYYYEAATEYEKANYRNCLTYCDRVEEILGSSNARIEVLRVKAYFQLGEMEEAQKSMNRFSQFPADESLRSEILPLIVRIEEAERERQQREQEAAEKRRALVNSTVFVEGLGLVKKGGKVGFINETGEEVIPFRYDDAFSFNNGTALVKLGGKWGMVDQTGRELIEPQYHFLSSFDADGLAYYTQERNNREWPWSAGVFDQAGNLVGSIATKKEQNNQGYIFRWVAHWLIEDNSSRESYEKAIFLYNKVAPGNVYYVESQLALGDIYYVGKGGNLDYQKALECYTRADERAGTPNWELRERIGDMHYAGQGTSVDKEKAMAYYKCDDFGQHEIKDVSMKYIRCAAEAGRIDDADRYLQQVIGHLSKESQKDSQADKLYFAAAYLYEQQGDKGNAIKWYKRAAKFSDRLYGGEAAKRLKAW